MAKVTGKQLKEDKKPVAKNVKAEKTSTKKISSQKTADKKPAVKKAAEKKPILVKPVVKKAAEKKPILTKPAVKAPAIKAENKQPAKSAVKPDTKKAIKPTEKNILSEKKISSVKKSVLKPAQTKKIVIKKEPAAAVKNAKVSAKQSVKPIEKAPVKEAKKLTAKPAAKPATKPAEIISQKLKEKTAQKTAITKPVLEKPASAKKAEKETSEPKIKTPVKKYIKINNKTEQDLTAKVNGKDSVLEEQKISRAKYDIESPSVCIEPQETIAETYEFPETYNDTRLTVLVRDPEWAFVYWDISSEAREKFKIPKGRHNRDLAIRVYDVTGIIFNGDNAISWYDILVNDYAISWYVRLPESGRSYILDLGTYSDQGLFQTIARSNCIAVPPNGISTYTDEQWMHITEETFMELFRMSGGFKSREEITGSENIAQLLSQRLQEGLFSGMKSSESLYSEMIIPKKVKGFWLIADAELIIYGATEPTAKVTVQGNPVKLTSQGTFSLRFALPDGIKNIPIIAVNEDGDDSREIDIEVTRKTS